MTNKFKYYVEGSNVHQSLANHILADGLNMVLDLEKSNGTKIQDKYTGKVYYDFFTCFASMPIGYNHPDMMDDEFINYLGKVALNKPSNSDVYTEEFATFVNIFFNVAVPEHFKYSFFVSGGALAVENALKAAFDWKVQKNFEKGCKEEKGHKIIYFNEAFHGRSGYTMTMTNTDPVKVKYFPKFDWFKVDNPKINFDSDDYDELVMREKKSISQITSIFQENKDDIAAIIIEPIQGEGGDNHFRPQFLKKLKDICIENDALLIFDEVQTGVGITGKWWVHEKLDVIPDIMAFGKKMQTCGILAGKRIDEVKTNVFHTSSRINSTWGGNLVDMVRSAKYIEIIEKYNYLENASKMGDLLLNSLKEIQSRHPGHVSNVRANGLFAAFDFTAEKRHDLLNKCIENGLLLLTCGKNSMRFRPPINVSQSEIEHAMNILDDSVKQIFR